VASSWQATRPVDAILTHIHTELVKGRVVSRHALCRQPDVDFWFDRANATRFNVAEKYFDEAAKTVKPYLDAGKGEIVFWKTAILGRIAQTHELLVMAIGAQASLLLHSLQFPTRGQLLMMSM